MSNGGSMTRLTGRRRLRVPHGILVRGARAVLLVAIGIGGADAANAPGTPASMEVPDALRQQNERIEASGIVWATTLQRYLIVSDDTGIGDHKHRPWIFAMNRQGVLDATPITIRGIDELNDAEAICAGPDGTFFLTTSHSLNQKGRARPARRMLLQLGLEGRALRVLGQLDLTATQERGGLLGLAGLDPGGSLDIEAITYREGALLVGLKAPLTTQGGAVILRLDRPVEVLRAGRIPAGSLSRFLESTLEATRSHGIVRRGISDLVGLPDGSLVLVANSPKGMPGDGGGAMYRLRGSAAVLVREFPGLKPEGVTLAEDGKGLVLVFDTDLHRPLWTRVALPD